MVSEEIPLKDLHTVSSPAPDPLAPDQPLEALSSVPSYAASSESVPRITLSPPALTLSLASPGSEILLSPPSPPSPTLGPRLSAAEKGKGKAKDIEDSGAGKEVWDVENPFGKDVLGTARPVTSYQPPQQKPMSKKPEPKPPELLPPERSRLFCLDGPTPKGPEDSYGRWLGELCIGAVLCQCCPCLRHDPEQY